MQAVIGSRQRQREDDSAVNYINNVIKDGDIILDIGSNDANYIYLMRKKLKRSGRIIAFQSQQYFYQKLLHLKKKF